MLCKYRLVDQAAAWYGQHVCIKWQKPLLAILAVLVFVATNIVHKWVVMGGVAVCVFLMFNIWKKGPVTEKLMLFLGKHSTNIWLVHMFFYAYFLKGLVLWAENPAVMFAALMACCIASSCVIIKIDEGIQKIMRWVTAR
jgi:peptidoglycan/LPS O-acetylase OafA/YrhL